MDGDKLHLTPEPTPARRHQGTADQMACQFAPLEHDKRGAETAGGFAIFVAAHHPSRLSKDELTTTGVERPDLAGAYFSTQCAAT
ncbi:hypothetical protein HBI62_212430 [Parastagonospora nodorum]|nr:hypothetical protein HBI62_212430 [Parastagonospora nodorum]KAH6083720.1 hypothetical protein HBI67_027490 [Parastagonospora nodorum]KAH6139981.1 hypothetical protein HBI63_207890 [Parastagonospora nodorum]